MAEPLPKQALDSAVNPSAIVQQTFELERRGFDQRQVQQYLRAVADSLRDAQQRESDMRSRLGKAVRRAETAEKSLRDTPSNDPSELTRQIGDEVTTVLDAARAAGEQRIAAAEASAERLMSNAKAEATKIRGAAETIMDERQAEADAAANEILAKGNADAEELREQARGEAEVMRTKAAERITHIRDECDALIAEAEEARAQILEDMERRRRQARAQVERLRVGRDRLLRSYDVVRRTLEETTVELKSSLQEAKVRGDTAARQVAGEPLSSRAQLEAELADAKLIGKVRTPKPAVLNSPALPRRLDPPQVPNIDLRTESAPTPRKPKVVTAKRAVAKTVSPKAPAVAPTLKAAPDAVEAESDATQAVSVDAQPMADATQAVSVDAQPMADAESTSAADVTVWTPQVVPAATAPEVSAEVAELEVAEAEIATPEVSAEVAELEVAELEVAEAEITAPGVSAEIADPADEPLDSELAQLEDHDLDVVEPSDEIEQVVALAAELLVEPASVAAEEGPVAEVDPAAAEAAAPEDSGDERAIAEDAEVDPAAAEAAAPEDTEPVPVVAKAAPSLFAALRAQSSDAPEAEVAEASEVAEAEVVETAVAAEAQATEPEVVEPAVVAAPEEVAGSETVVAEGTAVLETQHEPAQVEPAAEEATAETEMSEVLDAASQRDAVVADSASALERRLKRALADEQNDLLAGIRSASKSGVELTTIVGDVDSHLTRYVVAIHEAAVVAYSAGASLVDGTACQGELPAGAVEELLSAEVVLPIRERLASLDALEVESADEHLDPVRAFYRQRKTDHLGMAASRLAQLLCVSGACDALPADAALPWAQSPK